MSIAMSVLGAARPLPALCPRLPVAGYRRPRCDPGHLGPPCAGGAGQSRGPAPCTCPCCGPAQDSVRQGANKVGKHGRAAGRRPRRPDLYENPWTIPNLLSMTRIGLSPVLGYLVVGKDFNLALGIFVLAGITDLLDGYIARNWANQKSALGSALDPLADKILISVLYVCLTYANLIPVPLTVMIILRDIILIGAVFYVRYKTLAPPRTLGRYFNPCYATAQLEPTFISKVSLYLSSYKWDLSH
ncbi:hypothetical protein GDO81_008602 [Engystomops pustulosus]|uniref:Cardiolipin synthase (CMP-forming) n=1 Tax=Engystomops pustulosus TaxID=76066 RepID=A0AAV7CFW5_ENGPU|nr:hypothetical protein GDO81_008602 [Engystomops pustulosus]